MYVAIWHGFILVRILFLVFCFKVLIQWKVDYLLKLLFCLFWEGSCEYSDAIRLPYIQGDMWRYRKSSVHVWVNSMKRLYEPRHVISNNMAPWQAQTLWFHNLYIFQTCQCRWTPSCRFMASEVQRLHSRSQLWWVISFYLICQSACWLPLYNFIWCK